MNEQEANLLKQSSNCVKNSIGNFQTIYSVYDCKARLYSPLFTARTDYEAMRQISDLASDKSSILGKHPADYQLFKLGLVDFTTGCLSCSDTNVLVAEVEDLVNGN